MKIGSILIIFLLGTIPTLYGQHLFPEKFSDCNTDMFSLEAEMEKVPTDSLKLSFILNKSIRSKDMSKSKGELWLQIIVDLEGNSCLISMDNKTNISVNIGKLRKSINRGLKWETPNEKFAAIIVIHFNDGIQKFRRMGLHGKLGIHELKKMDP